MIKAYVVEAYEELGQTGNLGRFARKVASRYTEGSLQRLLTCSDPARREAALVALRMLGTQASNASLTLCLHDPDPQIKELAEGALWAIWFRADTPDNNAELQRLTKLIADKEYAQALAGLDSLIRKAPTFAEAYNQRAILYWRWGEYKQAVSDCERVLRLNPYHFGAQSGLAQCLLHMKKPVEALKAYRLARKINPNLDGVDESIMALEQFLNEERRRQEGR